MKTLAGFLALASIACGQCPDVHVQVKLLADPQSSIYYEMQVKAQNDGKKDVAAYQINVSTVDTFGRVYYDPTANSPAIVKLKRGSAASTLKRVT